MVRLTAWEARERRRNKAKAEHPWARVPWAKTQQQAEEAEQTVLDHAPAIVIPGIGSELSLLPHRGLRRKPTRFSLLRS